MGTSKNETSTMRRETGRYWKLNGTEEKEPHLKKKGQKRGLI